MNQGFKGFIRNNGKNGKERKNRKKVFFIREFLKISELPKNFRYFRCSSRFTYKLR